MMEMIILQSAKFMAEDEKVEPEVEQEYYQTLKMDMVC